MLLLAKMDLSIAQVSTPLAHGHQTYQSRHNTLKSHKKSGTLSSKSYKIDKIRMWEWNVCHNFSDMDRIKWHQPHILNTKTKYIQIYFFHWIGPTGPAITWSVPRPLISPPPSLPPYLPTTWKLGNSEFLKLGNLETPPENIYV